MYVIRAHRDQLALAFDYGVQQRLLDIPERHMDLPSHGVNSLAILITFYYDQIHINIGYIG